MRALYERLFTEAKLRGHNQITIAARAGLRQNQISRLFEINKYGPQAENFIKAIEGLGVRPSEFFRQIETKSAETAHGSQSSVLSNEKRAKENTVVAEGTLSYGGRSIPATADSITLHTLIEILKEAVKQLQGRLPEDRERRAKTRTPKTKRRQSRTRRVS